MFISTNELEKIHKDNSVLILDARSYKDYSKGHIPSAVNLDLFSFHWVDTSQKGLVSFGEHMRKILSYAGVDENKKIIFYDDVSGMLAARGVWMCLYFSHPDVLMLDGGLSKWTGENLPTVTDSCCSDSIRLFLAGCRSSKIWVDAWLHKRNCFCFKYCSIYEGFSSGNNCFDCIMSRSQRCCGLEILERKNISTPNIWRSFWSSISNMFRNGSLNTDEL